MDRVLSVPDAGVRGGPVSQDQELCCGAFLVYQGYAEEGRYPCHVQLEPEPAV